MQATLRLFDRLNTEIHLKEEEFPKLREQYQTLGKPLRGIGKWESMALLGGITGAWNPRVIAGVSLSNPGFIHRAPYLIIFIYFY